MLRSYQVIHDGTVWTKIHLMEMATHAERYGFSEEEFEIVVDLPPGGSLKVANLLITRDLNHAELPSTSSIHPA